MNRSALDSLQLHHDMSARGGQTISNGLVCASVRLQMVFICAAFANCLCTCASEVLMLAALVLLRAFLFRVPESNKTVQKTMTGGRQGKGAKS